MTNRSHLNRPSSHKHKAWNKMVTGVKEELCTLKESPHLFCYLIKATLEHCMSSLSFFPFHARVLPKSQWFNQRQAKLASVGRLWSYAGLVVWVRAMWIMEWRKEPYILMHIPFICVIHACPIWMFEGRANLRYGRLSLEVSCLLYLLYLLHYNRARGTGSLFSLTTRLIWSLLPSPSFLLCTEAFLFAHNQIVSLTSAAVPYSLTFDL